VHPNPFSKTPLESYLFVSSIDKIIIRRGGWWAFSSTRRAEGREALLLCFEIEFVLLFDRRPFTTQLQKRRCASSLFEALKNSGILVNVRNVRAGLLVARRLRPSGAPHTSANETVGNGWGLEIRKNNLKQKDSEFLILLHTSLRLSAPRQFWPSEGTSEQDLSPEPLSSTKQLTSQPKQGCCHQNRLLALIAPLLLPAPPPPPLLLVASNNSNHPSYGNSRLHNINHGATNDSAFASSPEHSSGGGGLCGSPPTASRCCCVRK